MGQESEAFVTDHAPSPAESNSPKDDEDLPSFSVEGTPGEEPVVTRRELWSYYRELSLSQPMLSFNCQPHSILQRGQCAILPLFTLAISQRTKQGVGPNGFSMTLFQSLANAAGYDPIAGPGSSCTAEGSSGQCVVKWGSGVKAVSSVVLLANGLSFAVRQKYPFFCALLTIRMKVMTLIFTSIGSAADYGTFGRWLLLGVTAVCWAAQFSSMSLTCEEFCYSHFSHLTFVQHPLDGPLP